MTILGYNPDTDAVETNTDHLFAEGRTVARVIRCLPNGRRLKMAMPYESFTAPALYEFLWAPLKALGVLDVWWSVTNSMDLDHSVNVTYQTGEFSWTQFFTSEMVRDDVAWKAIQTHLFDRLLVKWQHTIDSVTDGTGDLT